MNAEEHTEDTEEAPSHQNSDNDPDTGKAGFIAEDFRSDDIAVKLLEGQDEDQEIEGLHRGDQEDQEGAGNRAQKRPEEGDNIGHAHEDGHQGRIGEFENRTAHKAENTDNDRIQQFSADEAGEDAVGLLGAPEDPLDRKSVV